VKITIGLVISGIAAQSLLPPAVTPGPLAAAGPELIERFLSRSDTPLTSFVAFRHLTASARQGRMSGWLDACTQLDNSGFQYRVIAEGGSGSIRKRVLRPALEAELRARSSGESDRASLHPRNYEFLLAPAEKDDQPGLQRIALKPRRKESMLVDGWMFLTADGSDLVRIEGRLAKTPSFWTRRVDVIRRYTRMGSVRVPTSMESNAQVLLVGSGSFVMSYTYSEINGQPVSHGEGSDEQTPCTSRTQF
jgi:hypothetical protein